MFSQFPEIASKISLHLVEVSPALSHIQAIKLTGDTDSDEESTSQTAKESNITESEDGGPYRQEKSKYGPLVSWYKSLAEVPEQLSCYIGHEFLDALPIHKFHVREHITVHNMYWRTEFKKFPKLLWHTFTRPLC